MDNNEFNGLQESPIDLFDEEGGGTPPPQRRRVASNRDAYNNAAASGAREAQGQEVNRGYSNPGETLNPNPSQAQRRVRRPAQAQGQRSVQGQRPAQGQAQGQRPAQGKVRRQPQRQQVPPNQLPLEGGQMQQPVSRRKKGGILKILLVLIVLAIVGVVALKFLKGAKQEPAVQDYATSGKYAYDTLLNALKTYDNPAEIDAIVGTEEGDSWLAQEWAYVNGVKLRQEYLKKVGALVQFKYPQVQQMSTSGKPMTDASGAPMMVESYMNSGEPLTVVVPDYATITSNMDADSDYIKRMYKSYEDSAENMYRFHDDMFNLMMQYLCDKPELPTKEVEINMPVRLNTEGTPYVGDDAPLDDVLFGSDDFHAMSERFSQLCVGWTGFQTEYYTEKEEQHNDEFDAWYEKFIVLYEADGGSYDPETHTFSGGKFNKNTSKWEPWYLRDENNVIQLDETGEQIVNYFSIKDENGNDWIQPDEIIMVDVEKSKQVEDPWTNESGIYYNNLGTHFITTAYSGPGSIVFRVGDGSVEHPAGIGTPIITKALCKDGEYHDVEVALIGYWIDGDAIDYAEKFSQRNKGFTTVSVVKLITYELTIKNLEENDIVLDSEMTLCDRSSNIASRTGTMYDFKNENIAIKAGETVTVNDWASSIELEQKYVCWGRSFGRKYPTVYFDCLAGTGVIPSYSAYEQFTGSGKVVAE